MYRYILAAFFMMMFNTASEAHHYNFAAYITGHVTSVASLDDGILIGWDGDNAIHCDRNTIKIDKSRGEAFLDRAFKIALTAQVTDEKIGVTIIGCEGWVKILMIRLCSDELCPSLPGDGFGG